MQVPGEAPFDTLCVAAMREWRAGAEYPEGELVDVVGRAGDLETDRMVSNVVLTLSLLCLSGCVSVHV